MSDVKDFRNGYWRSPEERARAYDDLADSWREFPEGTPEPTPGSSGGPNSLTPADSLSRRRFFGVVGAGTAITATSGCIRKPTENILPFSERPEDMIPGKPIFYASAFRRGATVIGVLVESQDGRPTKIEGNPRHSGSQGATEVWAQSTVLDLYDADRTRAPLHEGAATDWDTTRTEIGALLQAKAGSGGQGLALVVDQIISPTMRSQLARFVARFPKARVFTDDAMAPVHANEGAEAVAGVGARVVHSLAGAHVVVALDSDVFGAETDAVRLSREWAKTRRVAQTPTLVGPHKEAPASWMSRLYVVEPHFSSTGVMADHRVRVKGSQVGEVLVALAKQLEARRGGQPAAADGRPRVDWPTGGKDIVDALPTPKLEAHVQTFVSALADDLLTADRDASGRALDPNGASAGPALPGNLGRSAVLIGERQPSWVHALGFLVNTFLKNNGQSVRWNFDASAPTTEPLQALAQAVGAGIDTVLCLGTNPAYDAPVAWGLADKLKSATTVHFGLYQDETGAVAKWHVPVSHWLEAWGDVRATDGTITIQQPLIDPLFYTYSALEWLGFFGTGSMIAGYDLVKSHYRADMGEQFSDRQWDRWLHDGVVTGQAREPVFPQREGWAEITRLRAATTASEGASEGAFGIEFHLDPKVADGRYGNNKWLQELPHPMSKLTWDNAAYVSKATAEQLGVEMGDFLTVTVDGRSLDIPAMIAPGQAENTVSISIGYGHDWGSAGKEVGFAANTIQPAPHVWFAAGTVKPKGGTHQLVSTQDYGSMKPPSKVGFDFPERPIVIERSVAQWAGDPTFVEKVNMMPRDRLKHLWDPPKLTGKQQWGMSIDLNTCTGCNSCVIACQAENNIPTVGKKAVSMNRDLHWMRIDRYYRGGEDEPTAVVQPMLCQHCESAPCETVCPVAATTHSPEGLNDMAYNRCIGTRYCSNNCPYKVRRFNFFNHNLDVRPGWNDDDVQGARLRQLQKNPDVTIRFRGVMEKCTYCVQRIQQAKIEAHVAGQDKVADGVIQTACQQVCPTGAIVFGDIADPDSAVSRAKANSRDYQVLRDLNNGPRTTYLARIRNTNPALVTEAEPEDGSHDDAKAGSHGA